MKMAIESMPDRINTGGIRFQSQDWGEMNVSHIHLPAGADAAPLLEGLPGNCCQVPHWGLVLDGSIKVDYADGQSEIVSAGEAYHWPAGHSVAATSDYRAIEFSPAKGMGEVMDHLRGKLGLD